MSTLTDGIVELLKGEPLELLGKVLGHGPNDTKAAADAGVSTVLAGLGTKVDTPGGEDAVNKLVSGADAGVLDDITGFLKGGDFSKGNEAVASIFGNKGTEVGDAVGKHLSLGAGMGGKLLSMLAPLVLGYLSRKGGGAGAIGKLLRGALPALALGGIGPILSRFGLGGHKAEATTARAREAAVAAVPVKRKGHIGWPLGALLLGLGLLILGLTSCNDDKKVVVPDAPPTTAAAKLGTLDAVATKDGGYSKILGLIGTAGLTGELAKAGPFTLLAPGDASLTDADVATLKADPNLKARLLQHIVPGTLTSDTFTDGQKLTTLAGNTVTVGVSGGNITFDGVAVATPDIKADNGVIHGLAGILPAAKKVSTGAGLAGGIAGDYGPWKLPAWRDKVYGKLKPAVAARASKLNSFQGGWGIRIK